MARITEGNPATGTWARPATPQMEKVGNEWVSKGWNELEHKGWVFKAVSRPPLKDAGARSALSSDLGLGTIPLPQNVFCENLLECHDKNSGVTLLFTARDALESWHTQQKNRMGSRLSPQHYDCTYSSPYSGTIRKDKEILRKKLRLARLLEALDFATPIKCKDRIPMHMLEGRGHIHFYDDLELMNDDLSGRGQSSVRAKIRVMDDFFLVLLRCYIVLSDERVYMRDVRYFYEFGLPRLLRDEEAREASAAQLAAAVSRLRPVSASIDQTAMQDPRFYTNPEQVWEALTPDPSRTATYSIALDF